MSVMKDSGELDDLAEHLQGLDSRVLLLISMCQDLTKRIELIEKVARESGVVFDKPSKQQSDTCTIN
jgi:hypothetical protein